MPAFASTCRCFVTAWRVMSVPDVSCVIESVLPAHNTATIRSRVSSPSAAKIGAELRSADLFSPRCPVALLRRGDMAFDVLHLDVPSAAVHAKRLQPARRRKVIAARLDDGDQPTAVDVLQLEDDQRARFLRVIDGGVHGAGMPPPRQDTLRLQALDRTAPRGGLEPGM